MKISRNLILYFYKELWELEKLNEVQLKEVEELQQICETEGFKLKLNWDTLRSRKRKDSDYFFYEMNRLIGFAAVYDFGDKAEICGMVHPDYRRRGIFTKLIDAGIMDCLERKYKTILLNAPAKSASAKGFLQSISCQFAVAEYQMKWGKTELFNYEGVKLRPSTHEDAELEIQLDIQCFGFSEEDARSFHKRMRADEPEQVFMIEDEEHRKTIGKIRVDRKSTETWIYGFAIFPEYQGRGFGRRILKQVVLEEETRGNAIYLEVEATNAHALRLYEECGFKVIGQQDYYQYQVKS